MGSLGFVEVDSVQPTLRWERFPRDHDLIGNRGQQLEITDVRYDIRVFDTASAPRGPWLVPAQQVYAARQISEPLHKIEGVLSACSDYFWTVRARFKLDGRVRVTEWAGAFSIAQDVNDTPWDLRRGIRRGNITRNAEAGSEWFYYPFMTPCD
jgi:hypothetical protein